MTANKEATATPLPEAEWMLDEANVPPPEVVACCMWEYARESESFLAATETTSRREGNVRQWERTPAAIAAIDRVLDLPSDHSAPLYQLVAVFNGRPWLQLRAAERALFAVMLPREVNPLRMAYLEEAKALIEANRTIPKENIERLRQWGRPEAELRRERILRAPNSGVDAVQLSAVPELRHPDDWRKGCSVIAVTVDFAHYDDDDLAEAFARLIKSARPPEFATPKRTSVFAKKAGKKLKDWRTALLRLGIMRALHAYTFADCRFPQPFKQRGEKACYFARKAALKTFHSLFPSLSREKPIHWLTKGQRSK
jgi:hypothetical protein